MPDNKVFFSNISDLPPSFVEFIPSSIELQLIESNNTSSYFTWVNNQLVLHSQDIGELNLHSCYIEIIARSRQITSELLVQSLGANYAGHSLLDITAGLGRDSIIFVLAGLDVSCVEYSATLIVCLSYANYLLRNSGCQLNIIYANSIDVLQNGFDISPQYIYFDPMFDEAKSAKSKKAMQMIAKFAYFDNQEKLFDLAYGILPSKGKLIVKRDNKQQYISSQHKVNYHKSGKTVRYDIYTK